MSSLSIVLKTVERCNLNCSYCYFFNGLDQTYLKRPKFITRYTVDALANFIDTGVKSLDIQDVHIVLHGGEPLMQPKEDFIYLVEKLKNTILVDLSFSLQTNATLVSNKWVDLLNKYQIGVGVSIDGPQEYHDKYRIDHQKNGSHERVINGIKLLQTNLSSNLGCLTVINPEFDGKIIYRHLVDDLGFKKLDFLLPDNNHSIPPTHNIEKYAKFLTDVFDQWIKDDSLSISVRKFKSIMLQLLGKESLVYGFGSTKKESIPLLAIRSDGEISPTDELMSTDPDTVTFTGKTVYNSSLKEIINLPIFDEIKNANHITPNKCSKCCWYNACGGGNLVSRFSKENRFNNHSVYCDALQEIFAHVSAYMINSGVSPQIITDNLSKDSILHA